MDHSVDSLFWLSCLSIEDVRNLVLILVAIIGTPLAIWRSIIAHRQSLAAQTQTELAENAQNLDRYQKGASALGDQRISVRQAGIFGLVRLAEQHPSNYLELIMNLLTSFIQDRSAEQRSANTENQAETPLPIDGDTLSAVQALLKLAAGSHHKLNQGYFVQADLSNADLRYADFSNADLRGAVLRDANLSGAKLMGADLRGADLMGAMLSDGTATGVDLRGAHLNAARLIGTDLQYANLCDADLRGADLSGANLISAACDRADFRNASMRDATVILGGLAHAYTEGVDSESIDWS